MFIVGFCIFSLYISFLFWNIIYQNKKQREEGNGTKNYDVNDFDGIGNQGRFPDKKPKNRA